MLMLRSILTNLNPEYQIWRPPAGTAPLTRIRIIRLQGVGRSHGGITLQGVRRSLRKIRLKGLRCSLTQEGFD